MKNLLKLLGITAFVAVIGFSMIACDSGGGGGGGKTPSSGSTRDPVTYTGTAGNVTYTLKIEDGGARAALTPAKDDKYTLTAGGKTSKGTVNSFTGGVLTLAPSKDSGKTFTAAVSGTGITAMTGTITYDDGTTASAPSITPPSGGKSITITGISGTGAPTGEVQVFISSTTNNTTNDGVAASGTARISGSSLTVNLLDTSDWKTAFTGSGSYYVCIWKDDTKSYWVTNEKKSITAANTTIPWTEFTKTM